MAKHKQLSPMVVLVCMYLSSSRRRRRLAERGFCSSSLHQAIEWSSTTTGTSMNACSRRNSASSASSSLIAHCLSTPDSLNLRR
ncbi:hypothetical protein ABB37_09918 [Leptomonas pyrrhocoris]|uniref:Uncharacterized protein n=1 Tax=Leptomonas pyrrhocoris TaxID=157538 RepID=A0A0M9FPE3_LEPPY|nr:hypothetical protein ABB37_09918 [Leptomonas pyrrhocoris]KPA73365.1 hypothetical protein ABB37_09918 [Leptomonas pyrrhocoris]|eukprot:XP_015651804.1 hypothetical protein ABB37_09918 [Leptomonas pyrrhocoris]